jgi:hypothetical protein
MLKLDTKGELESLHTNNVKESLHLEYKASAAIDKKDDGKAGHRRIAISLLAGTLNSAAAFSTAMASSGASTVPSRTALATIL